MTVNRPYEYTAHKRAHKKAHKSDCSQQEECVHKGMRIYSECLCNSAVNGNVNSVLVNS